MQKSGTMEESTVRVGASGFRDIQCLMADHRNLTRTCMPSCRTFLRRPLEVTRTLPTPIAWQTLMPWPGNWVYHGRNQKTSTLPPSSPTLVSPEIWKSTELASQHLRKRSTWQPSKIGFEFRSIPWRTPRNSTASFYMHAWSFLQAVLTSYVWKGSWPRSVAILTYHAFLPVILQKTSIGGNTNCRSQTSLDPPLHQSQSLTPILTQTLVQKLALGLPSVINGEHGVCYQDRRIEAGTLGGPNQSVSSSSSHPSSSELNRILTSRFMGTIKVLSRDGARVGAEISPPTASSSSSTRSLKRTRSPSIPNMCPLSSTQPTGHHEANIIIPHSSSLLSSSQKQSNPGSLTLMSPSLQSSTLTYVRASLGHRNQNQVGRNGINSKPSSQKKRKTLHAGRPRLVNHRFEGKTTPFSESSKQVKVVPYYPSLTPLPSSLRPHVPAKDRLRLWQPLHPRNILDRDGLPVNLADNDLERIKWLLEEAWAGSTTRELYGAGLLVYHVFCDRKGISEEQRAPAAPILHNCCIHCYHSWCILR